ncbi:MAG: hypothetical protein M1305_03890, partial [Candidatus Marsarchaeota archaeon]|nr:hypothetical protein [Candidatus Marsarchaeota archaeon]
NDCAVLWNLRRALRSNGTLVVHVPARDEHSSNEVDDRNRAMGHVRNGYTQSDIVEKLQTAGFRVARVRKTFGRFGSLARKLYHIAESKPHWCRWTLKLAFFPVCCLLAYGDILLETKTAMEGLLVEASAASLHANGIE